MTRQTDPVLDRRTLNRTLLQRQGLLERTATRPSTIIERLVGLQAQEPPNPYIALWSRILDFTPNEVSDAIERRELVRMGAMRTTLHLMSASDAATLGTFTADVHTRVFRSTAFAKALDGLDIATVVAEARSVLETAPASPSDLGTTLARRWPDRDRTALAAAARYHLQLVQVPPRGLWGRTGQAMNTTAEAWLGGPLRPTGTVEDVIRRYLAAFGPATVSDARTWSWLTGLRDVVEGMRPGLRTYRDETGRELFDLEDGVIADPSLPAPVRFLPQYDNVFLSHDDRSRLNGMMAWGIDFGWKGPILVDGFITGAWRVRRERGVATMTIELPAAVASGDRAEVEAEATEVMAFVAADASAREIQIVETS